ncbi:MAG TPA: efflux RND transporter permease subunit, partial [Thermoanaerobaculia bacterium]|nr:efflux RND transporter permease subunit [Thermoanaerobaculia bacterium]
MSLPSLAVRRPITTIMGLVCVLIIAALGISRMRLAFLPEIDAPFIGVQIPYPNSNPWQVEKEIVKPVEEALSTLSHIKRLNASANADSAEIFMRFDWGQDLDIIRMQVSEKIDQIKPQLPAGIGQVLIFSFNTNDIPVIEARIAAEGVDLSSNYDLIEARILNRLRRVPGVARVDLDGVAPREINIDLIMDQIKAHNVDVGDLIRKLQGASSNMVLGQVNDGGMRYTVRALGAFGSVDTFKDLPVNDRGLRLGDIADIRYEEPPIEYGRHLDGKSAVALNVFKESTANTVEVVHAAMKVITEDIAADPLLEGIKLFTWDDQAQQITNGVNGLTQSGLIGGLLAILILYFYLRRFHSTMIVAMSIPFSVIAACGVMYFMGKTLNILSMMGLMIGVGMLVDNAIVVLESIDRQQRVEPDAKKAALHGAGAVAMAVTASTLTSLIVFLPLIVGGTTELTIWLGEVGIAISLALICSLVSSLTMIPLMSAHFLKAAKEPKPNRILEWMEERYVRMLAWTLSHRVKMAFIIIGVVALTVVPFATKLVKTGMFSAQKNNRVRLQYEFKEFSYKSKSQGVVTQVEQFLWKNKDRFEVQGLYSFYTDNNAATWLTLNRDNMSDDEISDLRKKIRKDLPEIAGVRLYFSEDSDEGGNTRSFAVKIFGQDSTVLQGLAEEAERRLDTIDGIEDINTGLARGRQEF